MNLILIGLRGAGKTSTAHAVAARLGCTAIDLDEVVSASLGRPNPAAVFQELGEGRFREAEAAALERLLRLDDHVIALGGGTPMTPGAAGMLEAAQRSRRAHVIYLAASPGVLRDRLRATDLAQRPGLLGADPLAEIEELLSVRDPVYRELADEVIDTDPFDVAGLAQTVELAYVEARAG